jgi:hypothetical protein
MFAVMKTKWDGSGGAILIKSFKSYEKATTFAMMCNAKPPFGCFHYCVRRL